MYSRAAKPPSLGYRGEDLPPVDYLTYTSHGAILNTKSSITYTYLFYRTIPSTVLSTALPPAYPVS